MDLTAPEVAPAVPAPVLTNKRRDGRSARKTHRMLPFATRVSPEFDNRLRDIADRDGLLLVEVLERALEIYEVQQGCSKPEGAAMKHPGELFEKPGGPGQQELFEAETQWFHVFKAMVDSGELAALSGSAIKVYLVVKAHTNFSTGRAFPALETIAEKAGLTVSQVKREIKMLEEHGYISKEKRGRSNLYMLREKVSITGKDGRPQAVATWDYLPSTVQHAVADLRNVLVTGDLGGANIVHIERYR